MSQLIPSITPGALRTEMVPSRLARALAHQLGVVQASSMVDLARIDAAVQRHAAAADGVTAVAGRAMQEVALVSQSEQSLALTVPHASGRLAAIADAHALLLTGIVVNTARALERLA